MKQPVLRNTFMIAALCFLLTAAIPLILFSSGADGHFFLNSFFVNIGFTGDSIFAFALVFFLLFFLDRKDLAIRLLSGLMLSLALVQFFKNIFNLQSIHLYFEEGFPETGTAKNPVSSHTAMAFTLAAFFALHSKNIPVRVVLFFTAAAAAYSRIYFGSDSLLSVATGLVPAAAAAWMMHASDIGAKAKKIFKKKRSARISPQHLMPA